ncbi:MAG TPA: rhomboid family intramembrane serine protease [Nitrososphaeraceae archaeon]|nr:rhomboid family intramembrane serine protease [Nitrososphaeraceae archaeon]
MFPLHDDNQRLHGRPYVTYLLIAANAIIFLAEVIVTANFSDTAATNALLQTYGAIPYKVLEGDIFSVISSMFLHGGIAHLIGNMLFLFVFGDNIEDKFGRIKYVLFYIAWGFGAAYAHSFFAVSTGGGEIPAIGASGAISGVLGAYLVLFPRAKIFTIIAAFFITTVRIPAIAYIPFWFIMQIIFSVLNPLGGVAYLAHIGGFLAGLLSGYVMKNVITGQGMVTPQMRYSRKDRQNITSMPDMTVHTQPEVIKGSNFYEIIAEMPGLVSQSEIQANYDPNTQSVRVFTTGSRKYDINIRISDIQDDIVKIDQIKYLNGIVRIRISNQKS